MPTHHTRDSTLKTYTHHTIDPPHQRPITLLTHHTRNSSYWRPSQENKHPPIKPETHYSDEIPIQQNIDPSNNIPIKSKTHPSNQRPIRLEIFQEKQRRTHRIRDQHPDDRPIRQIVTPQIIDLPLPIQEETSSTAEDLCLRATARI